MRCVLPWSVKTNRIYSSKNKLRVRAFRDFMNERDSSVQLFHIENDISAKATTTQLVMTRKLVCLMCVCCFLVSEEIRRFLTIANVSAGLKILVH